MGSLRWARQAHGKVLAAARERLAQDKQKNRAKHKERRLTPRRGRRSWNHLPAASVPTAWCGDLNFLLPLPSLLSVRASVLPPQTQCWQKQLWPGWVGQPSAATEQLLQLVLQHSLVAWSLLPLPCAHPSYTQHKLLWHLLRRGTNTSVSQWILSFPVFFFFFSLPRWKPPYLHGYCFQQLVIKYKHVLIC